MVEVPATIDDHSDIKINSHADAGVFSFHVGTFTHSSKVGIIIPQKDNLADLAAGANYQILSDSTWGYLDLPEGSQGYYVDVFKDQNDNYSIVYENYGRIYLSKFNSYLKLLNQ